jgi:hypothetical protein
VFALIAVATALMEALDSIHHREFTQAGTVTQRRQIGLSNRSGDSQLYILIHGVDKSHSVDYIMIHSVADFNQ